jgi:hypothetical protein
MMEGASCLPRLVCLPLPCKRESGTGPVRFDGSYATAKLEESHRLTTTTFISRPKVTHSTQVFIGYNLYTTPMEGWYTRRPRPQME